MKIDAEFNMQIIKTLTRNNVCIIYVDDDDKLSNNWYIAPENHAKYLIVRCNNNKFYYKLREGTAYFYVLHRNGDKPAVIVENNCKTYWKNGDLHRDSGPAVIYSNFVHYYLNGKKIDFNIKIKKSIKFKLSKENSYYNLI